MVPEPLRFPSDFSHAMGTTSMSTTETWSAPDLSRRNDDPWRQEQQAFHRLLPDLLRTHPGQFVAIFGGRVVEAGLDKLDVARRCYEQFGYVPIFVGRVVAGPANPLRLPSPRLIDRPAR